MVAKYATPILDVMTLHDDGLIRCPPISESRIAVPASVAFFFYQLGETQLSAISLRNRSTQIGDLYTLPEMGSAPGSGTTAMSRR